MASPTICLVGSPAPAGIDPERSQARRCTYRLPRARGDRPARFGFGARCHGAPPRPRGSTRHLWRAAAHTLGSPAPAGIDLRYCAGCDRSFRLPRARGDRPSRTFTGPLTVLAPPRPRGSTPAKASTRVIPSGSPAPAGIDPLRPRITWMRYRLPRARGDRPSFSAFCVAVIPAPPRPRGSTSGVDASCCPVGGSPAPAGIDPTVLRGEGKLRGLPRARGDRPCIVGQGEGQMAAPPRPRGSTSRCRGRGRGLRGSPAPAGIDPLMSRSRAKCIWLPRARGDRPRPMTAPLGAMTAPPRPRGSTRAQRDCRGRPGRSPAPAGIDLGRPAGAVPSRRLPRARGDRPPSHPPLCCPGRAPPRPRGSTRRSLCCRSPFCGSPAPAGIDPASRLAAASCSRLPRARGDRPWHDAPLRAGGLAPPRPRGSTSIPRFAAAWAAGSPAPAGIDLWSTYLVGATMRLPRARGDRPSSPSAPAWSSPAPPRPRGSTLFILSLRLAPSGSPAPAGIDPVIHPLQAASEWLPRARGDRPSPGLGLGLAAMAPPRPRGSTPRGCRRCRWQGGSPAPAGIDPIWCLGATRSGGLPRARGDRPIDQVAWEDFEGAPPRPRGSTRVAGRAIPTSSGSPAPAGIDLSARRLSSRTVWLPRARGDRPPVQRCASCSKRAPPRPRGSTQGLAVGVAVGRGSPAPAGIDLTGRAPGHEGGRLPRARGDRPGHLTAGLPMAEAPPRPRGSTSV